jgi:hypothetical protein
MSSIAAWIKAARARGRRRRMKLNFENTMILLDEIGTARAPLPLLAPMRGRQGRARYMS